MKVTKAVRSGTRVELPADVARPFEVYVNGVRQREGADFRIEDRALRFTRELRQEGKLGFWRWASIMFGAAGTYRQNDLVDVIYERGGQRAVASALPVEPLERRLATVAARSRSASSSVSCPGSSRHAQLPSGSPGVFIRPSLPRPSTSCAGIMQSAGREESASSISFHGSRSGKWPLSVSVSWVVV